MIYKHKTYYSIKALDETDFNRYAIHARVTLSGSSSPNY